MHASKLAPGGAPAPIDTDLRAAGLTVDSFGRPLRMAAKRELLRAALLEAPEGEPTAQSPSDYR